MTCSIPDCDNLAERNGICATHNREQRKTIKESLKPNKKPVRIKKVGYKQAKQLAIYAKKKEAHLLEHPDCQVKLVGCTNQNNTVHHTAKRGINLNNEETFMTACDYCHDKIHFVLSAKENKELGFLVMVIILLTSISSFAQLRAPVQQTIFYQSETNLPTKIEIYQDSVRAFDLTWKIKKWHAFKADGDKLLKATVELTYKTQSATLLVNNRKALFIVPGIRDIELIQLSHESFRYKF